MPFSSNVLGMDIHDSFLNIGWYCSDRICMKGMRNKIALHFENSERFKNDFTFNDIQKASDSAGSFLKNMNSRGAEIFTADFKRLLKTNTFAGIDPDL